MGTRGTRVTGIVGVATCFLRARAYRLLSTAFSCWR